MGQGGEVSILHCIFQPLGPEPIPLAFGVLMGRGYSPAEVTKDPDKMEPAHTL